MYYFRNRFYIIMTAPDIQVLQKVQNFVQGLPKTIEAHVRNITFSVHYRIDDISPYNERLEHFLNHLPYRFILTDGKAGSHGAEWTDYLSARGNFVAELLADDAALAPGMLGVMAENVYDRELLPRALELFDAAWLLAHTFPEAKKRITTTARLPMGRRAHTLW